MKDEKVITLFDAMSTGHPIPKGLDNRLRMQRIWQSSNLTKKRENRSYKFL